MKIKDNLLLLSAAAIPAILIPLFLFAKRAPLTPAILSPFLPIFISARLIKVIQKNTLEYLNGPKRFCKGKGIEIGSGAQPMIGTALSVDIVDDFSDKKHYKVDYAADAHDLPEIEDRSLDYVCAGNVLEHLTNPIKAILEWMRVIKPKGIIWLKIPDKRKTFDRSRERTKLSHLIEDFKAGAPVDDPTHIDDHNKNSSPPRVESHPYVHNHVWIPDDIVELFNHIQKNHARCKIIRHSENTRKHAQDFWIVVQVI